MLAPKVFCRTLNVFFALPQPLADLRRAETMLMVIAEPADIKTAGRELPQQIHG